MSNLQLKMSKIWSTNLQEFYGFSQHQQRILRKISSTINNIFGQLINNQQAKKWLNQQSTLEMIIFGMQHYYFSSWQIFKIIFYLTFNPWIKSPFCTITNLLSISAFACIPSHTLIHQHISYIRIDKQGAIQ